MLKKKKTYRSQTNYRKFHASKKKENFGAMCWNFLQGFLTVAFVIGGFTLFIWGWQRLHDPTVLPIKHINFVGELQHVSTNQLQITIQKKINGGFFVLDIDEIRNALQLLPWVSQVSIERVWPDSLDIQIKEQNPVARWGNKGLINSSYQIFYPPANTIPPNLPVLEGPFKNRKKMVEFYQKIQGLFNAIDLRIAVLKLNTRQSWRLQLDNGIKIILGQQKVLDRCQRLVHLYPKIVNANAEDVQHIDLRYSNGIAVKWRSIMKKNQRI